MKHVKIAVVGLSGQSVFLKVDHFHKQEETLQANAMYVEPGGKGYNQAVAASRLGASVSFLSAVGMDSYADECERILLQEHVQPFLVRKAGFSTAFATILTNNDGDNQVTVYRGALLEESDVVLFEEEIKTSDLVLLQHEIPHQVNVRVQMLAKMYQKPVVLNPAPARKVSIEELNAYEILTPNISEVKDMLSLPEDSSLEVVKEAISLKITTNMIVTLGEVGALVWSNKKFHLIPSRKVNSIDTTGAGDTFTAALCVRLALGDDLITAASYATIAASLCVQRAHVISSLPTKEEVEKILN